jgi:hypothetical protein
MAAVQNKPKVEAKGRGGNPKLSFWKKTKGFFRAPFVKNKFESSDSESQDYCSTSESEYDNESVSTDKNLIAVVGHSPNHSYNLRSRKNIEVDSPKIHRSGAGISWQIQVPSAASTPKAGGPVVKPDINQQPPNCGLHIYDDDISKMTQNGNMIREVKKLMQSDNVVGRGNSGIIDNDELGACGETKNQIDVNDFKERLKIMKLAYRLGDEDKTLSLDEAITQAANIRKQQIRETETNSAERFSAYTVPFEPTGEEAVFVRELADKNMKENNMSLADAMLAAIEVIKQRRQGAIPKLKDNVQIVIIDRGLVYHVSIIT